MGLGPSDHWTVLHRKTLTPLREALPLQLHCDPHERGHPSPQLEAP
jgi:hypothetical protein